MARQLIKSLDDISGLLAIYVNIRWTTTTAVRRVHVRISVAADVAIF